MSKTSRKRTAAAAAPPVPVEIAASVTAAAAKKAADLVVLDLRKAGGFTDYFVIATGQNARQNKAIADAVEDALRQRGARPAHVEGYERAEWILLDYFDFVVHVFAAETRAFYGLERLWGSAISIDLSDLVEPDATRR